MSMFRKHSDNKLVQIVCDHFDGTKFNVSSAINNEFHLRASFIKRQRIQFWEPSQKEKLETKVTGGRGTTGGTLGLKHIEKDLVTNIGGRLRPEYETDVKFLM